METLKNFSFYNIDGIKLNKFSFSLTQLNDIVFTVK